MKALCRLGLTSWTAQWLSWYDLQGVFCPRLKQFCFVTTTVTTVIGHHSATVLPGICLILSSMLHIAVISQILLVTSDNSFLSSMMYDRTPHTVEASIYMQYFIVQLGWLIKYDFRVELLKQGGEPPASFLKSKLNCTYPDKVAVWRLNNIRFKNIHAGLRDFHLNLLVFNSNCDGLIYSWIAEI